jgi:hypothetical protein
MCPGGSCCQSALIDVDAGAQEQRLIDDHFLTRLNRHRMSAFSEARSLVEPFEIAQHPAVVH